MDRDRQKDRQMDCETEIGQTDELMDIWTETDRTETDMNKDRWTGQMDTQMDRHMDRDRQKDRTDR